MRSLARPPIAEFIAFAFSLVGVLAEAIARDWTAAIWALATALWCVNAMWRQDAA